MVKVVDIVKCRSILYTIYSKSTIRLIEVQYRYVKADPRDNTRIRGNCRPNLCRRFN